MPLVDQWQKIEAELGDGWSDARLRLTLEDDAAVGRASALLGPLNPWGSGREIRLAAVRRGAGAGPESIRRSLRRLDAERLRGTLELVSVDAAPAAPAPRTPSLAEAWDEIVQTLPPDWSDLYLELELRSTDYLPRASLDMTPLNARRPDERPTLRFRVARSFGYGASPGMARRCLERCDRDSIRGELRLLRVLSDTDPVGTQGPVWYVGGRTT